MEKSFVPSSILPLFVLLVFAVGCPIDHDPPDPVVDPVVGSIDLIDGSDTGVSNTDNVTSDTTPSFTGTSDMSGTLEIVSDVDGVVYSGPVPAGSWGPVTAKIVSHAGTTGTVHHLRARITAQGGGVGQSDALSVTFDTTAPVPDSFLPADDTVLVVWNSDLTVSFTETIYAGTGSVTLRNSTDATDVSYDVSAPELTGWGTNALTLNPNSDLDSNRNFCILQDAGAVTDAAGNACAGITDNAAWNFSSALRDMFSYPASGDLVTQSGGVWTELSGGAAVAFGNTQGKAWTNYVSSPTGRITCIPASDGQEVRCELASPWQAADGAVYLAFIVKEQTAATPFVNGCGIAFYNGPALLAGVSLYNMPFPPEFGLTAYVDDNTDNRQKLSDQMYYDMLFVFRYDPNAPAGEKLKGWYYLTNFDTGTVEGTGSNRATGGFDPATSWTQITHIGISQRWRCSNNLNPQFEIDALKVVRSWDDLDEGR